MSYDQHISSLGDFSNIQERFREDVFKYLERSGRTQAGFTYFGVKAANYPDLVAKLRDGRRIGHPVMLRVWCFMRDNPPDKFMAASTGSKKATPVSGGTE